MSLIKKFFWVLFTITKVLVKFIIFMVVMLAGGYALAPMGEINSKDIDMSLFAHAPNETMMMMFQNEMFSGYLFMVTITLVLFVCYLFWQIHEVAVHHAQDRKSTQIQLVFALSLCGLFLHKAWWVLAIIIAFANWEHVQDSLSRIIRNGLNGPFDKNKNSPTKTVTEQE